MKYPLALPTGRLVLVRHGQTSWSRSGRHTGLTDIPLLPEGEQDARRAGAALADLPFALVLSSPLQRARRTAELAGFAPTVTRDLQEWDYGGYEGLTRAEIQDKTQQPWDIFRDGVVPGATPGETVEEVAARTSRVLTQVAPVLADGNVLLVAHGHLLRVLAATWLRMPPRLAAGLVLEPGAVSVLGYQHDDPAIRVWNRRETAVS